MPTASEILLIEDTPADAELIAHALESAGLDVQLRVLADGVQALDYLLGTGSQQQASTRTPPRLVLLDLKLPKINGLEVLRQLKSAEQTRAIPVVMLTSSKVERDVAAAYRHGANSYVQKPLEFERLRHVVQALGRYWLEVSEPVPPAALMPEPQ